MHSHLFIRTLVLVAGTVLTCSAVTAQSTDIESNPAAESFVRAQFARGEAADLAARFTDPNQRGLSGDFLYNLIHSSAKIDARRGLVIAHAVFPEGLDLNSVDVPFDVQLSGCRFLDDVEISQSHFKKNLQLNQSEFDGFVNLIHTEIDGNLEMAQSRFNKADGEGDFSDLRVDGS